MMRIRSISQAAAVVTLFAALWALPAFGAYVGWPQGGQMTDERVLGSPLLVDLDGDGRMEIVVVDSSDRLFVYDHTGALYDPTGALQPGWPQTLGFSDGTLSSPAVGDVDGDSAPEIVVVGDNNLGKAASVKVFDIDGSLVASVILPFNTNASGKATPCLFDCRRYSGQTLHPAKEILVRDGDGRLHVLTWGESGFTDLQDGSSDYETADTSEDELLDRYGAQPITGSVSACMEMSTSDTLVFVGSTDGNIYHWRIESDDSDDWDLTKNTPLSVTGFNVRFYSSVTLADLDDDGGRPDVIVGDTLGRMHVWTYSTGSAAYGERFGWPRDTYKAIVSSPAVADIDDDGYLEIVVGSNSGLVYAWHDDGTTVTECPGWPVAVGGEVFASPVIAQLDQTGPLEVIVPALDGYVYVLDSTGNALSAGNEFSRWPKRMNTQFYASAAVGDIHGGGRMSIVTGGYDGRVHVFDLRSVSSDTTAGWLQFRGSPLRDGVYP